VFPDYSFPANYFQVEGGRLHYVDVGRGPVIVMVHGNPTWSYYFRHLITFLKSTHRIIVIDHMGCGLSDKPTTYPYCLAKHIENLEQLLAHLNINNFSLVVHDWGGAIGFGCAVRRLHNLEKIVVMNSAAFRSSRIPLRISLCRAPLLGQVIVRLLNGFARPALYFAVKKKMADDVAAAFIAPYNNWRNRIAVYQFVKDIPLHKNDKSYETLLKIENRLPEVRAAGIPLLIVWGGADFCFNDHFYNEWKNRFPQAESYYFKDGGHYVLEDKSNEVLAAIARFFGQ